ncbi:D-alanyl-D-alanine carboxypeptidase/D-alanyl-D-alanine-endopeptidase [Robiginitalea aurantiaca]|uniref:D-alanyl-D-alanine carboxypeptidase n=1 Tax=Robiginitalea aurantiaca TaxID=3056915 RepID=A0ABT7WCJ6_9FLAO|nr:D-alanyl-D-alanine carboxypeptidase [Robiginitalea aurantiaca]MDM9630637.1 D-alanyl-D-alanine carboxypeptidase [Robiginitalea aurantiaca]
MRKTLIFRGFIGGIILLNLALTGCSTQKKVGRFLDKQLETYGQESEFTGLLMVDAQSGDTLISRNRSRYFTPASTTKVFTLYAALKELPRSIPALKYQVRGDTLHVLGTGDPSAMHPVLNNHTARDFIRQYPNVVLYESMVDETPWGPGWAWDDFDQGYQAERSSLPIYGNVLRLVRKGDRLELTPESFRDSLVFENNNYRRRPERNQFFVSSSLRDTTILPLTLSPVITKALWEEATGLQLNLGKTLPGDPWQILAGIPSDSIYREMMAFSDNFLAEQLMLLVSSTLSDSLSFKLARDYILETHLSEMPSPPRWVDGSGLSRYNLISPESLVYLLLKLYREIPQERLFSLMAQGGQKGTLENWYKDPDGPFLFGKTGTLSNNHNLCGFLKTKSGKTVAFSFMNNHYLKPTSVIKNRMQRILLWVRENY